MNKNSEIPDSYAGPRAKKRGLKWIILVTVLIVFVCCGGGAAYILNQARMTRAEKARVQALVDTFMRSMADKKVEPAYALFSSRAKEEITPYHLSSRLYGEGYTVFKDYQNTALDDLSISAPIFSLGYSPGTTAEARGYITYENGATTTFEATLEMEDGQWKLMHIFIALPR